MNVINSFKLRYFFLSNFYECKVRYQGLTFNSSEAAFQAAKTKDMKLREKFCNLNPSEAKRLGRSIKLRNDWEDIKDDVMEYIVAAKFSQNLDLLEKLINTGDSELIEGNEWGDYYWGTVRGEGENKLGKILMKIRSQGYNIIDNYSLYNVLEELKKEYNI